MSYPSHKNWKSIPTIDETTEYGSVIHWSEVIVVPYRNHPVYTTRVVPITCVCSKRRTQSVNDLKQHKYKGLCLKCSAKLYAPRGSKHSDWNGGVHINSRGYRETSRSNLSSAELEIALPMFKSRNYVQEHRLTMALHLKRPLSRDEHVHHINGEKLDNRIENLQLVSPSEHADVELTWARAELARLREILDVHGISY